MEQEQQVFDRLERECKERKEAALLEIDIRKNLPVAPRWVHKGELYGTIASVDYECNLEDVANLIAMLPEPEPTVLVKGTFTSFLLESYANTLPDDRVKSQEEVWPYRITMGSNQSRMKFDWFGKMPMGVCRFKVEIPLHSVRAWFVRAEKVLAPGYAYYKNISLETKDERCHTIFWKDEAVAGSTQPLRWASGGHKYINDFTWYWVPNKEGTIEYARAAMREWVCGLT
jgi:hypothetical protein